jgi:hypothetical protein
MKRHPLMEQYCQGIVFDLVDRGLIVTCQRVADLFSVEIRWPGPNGRDAQEFKANGATLLDALEQTDRHAGKILPVKCSTEMDADERRKSLQDKGVLL